MKPQKEKRLRQKAKALAEKIKSITAEILSAVISGLITTAILKLLGW